MPDPLAADGATLAAAIRQHAVTHLVVVPALLRRLAVAPKAHLVSLQHIVSSGDWLPGRTAEMVRAVLPSAARLWNVYGASEVCADALSFCIAGARPAALFLRQNTRGGCELWSVFTLTSRLPKVQDWRAESSGQGSSVPLGEAIGNTQVHLLPVHAPRLGEQWQLVISGPCLAHGYITRCQREAPFIAAAPQVCCRPSRSVPRLCKCRSEIPGSG